MLRPGLGSMEALGNIRAAYRRFAEGFPHGRTREDRELLLIDSGSALTELNVAFVTTPPSDPRRTVERAAEFFRERPQRWRLEGDQSLLPTLAGAAEEAGLTEVESRPALTVPIPLVGGADVGARHLVRAVTSPEESKQFADVLARGSEFLPPPELFEVPFHRLAPLRCYIAWEGQTPVACSMLLPGAYFGGIYAVATLPSHRRQGQARALTVASLTDAVSVGCRESCLQASPMGLPLYHRIGFRRSFDDVVWTSPQRSS
ncbi:MAG: GNAT family N-acetyltransferase [Thermoplasmata archaeon]|nr:GNAT family N-acetyltransferase [Thermoplasmata archaeon]